MQAFPFRERHGLSSLALKRRAVGTPCPLPHGSGCSQVGYKDDTKVFRCRVEKNNVIVNALNRTKREDHPDLAALQEERAKEYRRCGFSHTPHVAQGTRTTQKGDVNLYRLYGSSSPLHHCCRVLSDWCLSVVRLRCSCMFCCGDREQKTLRKKQEEEEKVARRRQVDEGPYARSSQYEKPTHL